jgi:WD40 repeat protein
MESKDNKNNDIEFERLSNENNTFKINIKITPNNNILINCRNTTSTPNLIYEKSFSFDELKNFENFKESNSISEVFENFKKLIDIKAEKNIFENEKKILLKFTREDLKKNIEFEILQIDRPSEEVVKELIEIVKNMKEKNDTIVNRISEFEDNQSKMEEKINELKNEIKNLKTENLDIKKQLNVRNQTKDFSLSGISIKKEVKYSDYIFCLATLNDNRIASGCKDGFINIYNLNYDLDFQIKEHSGRVFYLFTHSNGNLISCSYDKTIKVFSFLDDDNNYKCIQTISNHRSAVFKVIEIHEEKILSISADKTIKIFNKENNDEFTYEKTIKCNDISEDVVLCLDKEIATASHSESIHFFNYEFGEEENNSPIMEIKITGWNNVLKVLNENLFVCGFGGIYLINLNTKDIIKKYEFTNKLSNFEDLKFCLITNIKNKFIFGDNEGGLMSCDFNDNTKKLTFNEYKVMHESWIRTLLLRKEDIFITAGNDCKMKIWK